MFRTTLTAALFVTLAAAANSAQAGGCNGGGRYRPLPVRPVVTRPVVHPVVVHRPVVTKKVVQPKPAPPAPRLPQVVSGSQLFLEGQNFGGAEGKVVMKVGPLTVPVTVLEWNAVAVVVQMPEMALDLALPAKLTVLRANGSLVTTKSIELTPDVPRLALN